MVMLVYYYVVDMTKSSQIPDPFRLRKYDYTQREEKVKEREWSGENYRI